MQEGGGNQLPRRTLNIINSKCKRRDLNNHQLLDKEGPFHNLYSVQVGLETSP